MLCVYKCSSEDLGHFSYCGLRVSSNQKNGLAILEISGIKAFLLTELLLAEQKILDPYHSLQTIRMVVCAYEA